MKRRLCVWLAGATLAGATTIASAEKPAKDSVTVGDVATEVQSDSKVDEELYPTGELKIRRVVSPNASGDLVRSGAWKMWKKDGSTIAEGHYRNDKRDGEWTRVHETLAPNFDLLSSDVAMVFAEAPFNSFEMPFTSRATFKADKLHGKWSITDAKDRVIYEWHYAKGLRDGLATWYHSNGTKMAEMTFRGGVLHGPRKHYDANGTVTMDQNWQEGRLVSLESEYYDEAKTKIKSQGYHLGQGYQVHTADDWWEGRAVTYTRAPEVQSELHGSLITYYETGEKESEGIYEHNKREGVFKWWFSNGNPSAEGKYTKDKMDGPWIWKHSNGQTETKGGYKMGKPIGLWVKWTEDGSLKMKKDFAGGDAEIVTTPEEDREDAAKSATLIPLGKGKIR